MFFFKLFIISCHGPQVQPGDVVGIDMTSGSNVLRRAEAASADEVDLFTPVESSKEYDPISMTSLPISTGSTAFRVIASGGSKVRDLT